MHQRNCYADRRLVVESPEMHNSSSMQAFIKQEVAKPSKQWIHEVLGSKREVDRVKLRTEHFVLLPDFESSNKRVFFSLSGDHAQEKNNKSRDALDQPIKIAPYQWTGEKTGRRWLFRRPYVQLHWLAVVTDTGLRTMRDLRGTHIPMLQQLHKQCCHRIWEETGIPPEKIMAYVHYPPSVYQLHVHFKHPINAQGSCDTLRVHSLTNIINNLQIDPDYYAKSAIQLPVYQHSDLFFAMGLEQLYDAPDIHLCPSQTPNVKETEGRPVEKSTDPVERPDLNKQTS
jgi:hypothetical protein